MNISGVKLRIVIRIYHISTQNVYIGSYHALSSANQTDMWLLDNK